VFTGGAWQDAGLFLRTGDAPPRLAPGDRVKGPAIIVEDNQTIVVEPGWQAEVTGHNQLLLTRFEAKDRAAPIGTRPIR
jgi:5-oxoprolinase (ATP-hydrolysing)